MDNVYLEPLDIFIHVSKSFEREGGRSTCKNIKKCKFCLEYVSTCVLYKSLRNYVYSHVSFVAVFAVGSHHYSRDSRNYVPRVGQTG